MFIVYFFMRCNKKIKKHIVEQLYKLLFVIKNNIVIVSISIQISNFLILHNSLLDFF